MLEFKITAESRKSFIKCEHWHIFFKNQFYITLDCKCFLSFGDTCLKLADSMKIFAWKFDITYSYKGNIFKTFLIKLTEYYYKYNPCNPILYDTLQRLYTFIHVQCLVIGVTQKNIHFCFLTNSLLTSLSAVDQLRRTDVRVSFVNSFCRTNNAYKGLLKSLVIYMHHLIIQK